MTTLYIDADACPVKDEAIRTAERHRAPVKLVCNGGIRPPNHPLVELVVTPDGPDAADAWIAERIGPGDVCVTADIPLAARCVEAGAEVVTPTGERIDAANVGPRLAARDLMADMRAANPLAAGGGAAPFSKADRSRFLTMLDQRLTAAARAGR